MYPSWLSFAHVHNGALLGPHMGAVEISAGGAKKSFREWDYKKDPGRGTVFKTLGMGREGTKMNFLRNCHFWAKILVKIKNFEFFLYFLRSGRGKAWKMSFFLYWGGQFLPQGGGLGFEGSAYGHTPRPPPLPMWLGLMLRAAGNNLLEFRSLVGRLRNSQFCPRHCNIQGKRGRYESYSTSRDRGTCVYTVLHVGSRQVPFDVRLRFRPSPRSHKFLPPSCLSFFSPSKSILSSPPLNLAPKLFAKKEEEAR